MLLAERAGRKLERRSNSAPRGMTVIAWIRKVMRRNKIRPTGLLHFNFANRRRPRGRAGIGTWLDVACLSSAPSPCPSTYRYVYGALSADPPNFPPQKIVKRRPASAWVVGNGVRRLPFPLAAAARCARRGRAWMRGGAIFQRFSYIFKATFYFKLYRQLCAGKAWNCFS